MKYAKHLAIALVCLLAAPISLGIAKSYYKEHMLKEVRSEKSENVETANDNLQLDSLPEYQLVRRSAVNERSQIYYPKVTGLPSRVTEILVNEQLENTGKNYTDTGRSDSRTVVDYEVVRQDGDLLTVVFRGGKASIVDGSNLILSAVTFNLRTGALLTAKKLIKNEAWAKDGVSALLDKAAKENPVIENVQSFGDWMGVYVTGENIVFYYQDTGSEIKNVELSIPIESIRPYLSDEYRSLTIKPSSANEKSD